jgi:hypothetical protein
MFFICCGETGFILRMAGYTESGSQVPESSNGMGDIIPPATRLAP